MLDSVFQLWLPILVSAIAVFFASSVIHMVLPIHKSDYRGVPNEAAFLEALRAAKVPSGEFMFPICSSMKDMSNPEYLEKLKRGPVGSILIRPSGDFSMGKSLGQWFVFCVVIGFFVAYIASIGTPRGAASGDVFRITGAIAILGHAFGNVTNSIWKGVSWTITAKFVFDGVVYALVTAACFAWLWPAAA
ncbi:MAG: hypothetical protein IT457_06285 [Planctomycetes bacterium]|nr:hypothetical protein [Planctomycetota bacterium]